MTDSEECSSPSLQQDLMSVSDQEGEASREEEMCSEELSEGGGCNSNQDYLHSSSRLSSTSNEMDDLPSASHEVSSIHKLEDSLKASQPVTSAEIDPAVMELLSRSYSEIVISPEPKTTDANIPQPLTLLDDGLVLKEGDMVHFIAKNLESKIKSSGSDVFCSSDPSLHLEMTEAQCNTDHEEPSLVSVPESTLSLLEKEARCIAASLDGLTEHLAASLHTISAVTAQSLGVYKDSVCKTCDAMDANIKSMYQLMAKCEELSKSMSPIYKQAEQVKEIKKLLDLLENIG